MIAQLERSESVLRIKITSARQVLGREPSTMYIDNLFLHSKDLNVVFYGFSRLKGLLVKFNVSQMNCDVVLATFFMVG